MAGGYGNYLVSSMATFACNVDFRMAGSCPGDKSADAFLYVGNGQSSQSTQTSGQGSTATSCTTVNGVQKCQQSTNGGPIVSIPGITFQATSPLAAARALAPLGIPHPFLPLYSPPTIRCHAWTAGSERYLATFPAFAACQ